MYSLYSAASLFPRRSSHARKRRSVSCTRVSFSGIWSPNADSSCHRSTYHLKCVRQCHLTLRSWLWPLGLSCSRQRSQLLRGSLEVRIHRSRAGSGERLELVVLSFCFGQCRLVGDASGVAEDVALVERQEAVQLLDPVSHV